MERDESFTPKILEKVEMPITIGVGNYYIQEPLIRVYPLIRESFMKEYPTLNWEYIFYKGRDHLIESVRRFCPQILIISGYWGHSGYDNIRVYVDDFLRETIEDRNKRGSSKPFIVLTQSAFAWESVHERYKKDIHYDICPSNFYDEQFPKCFRPDTLIKLLPDKAFVPNC